MASHAVEIHGGVVEKFIGDAVVARVRRARARTRTTPSAPSTRRCASCGTCRGVLDPGGLPGPGAHRGEHGRGGRAPGRRRLAGGGVSGRRRRQHRAPACRAPRRPGVSWSGPTTYAADAAGCFRFEELEPVALKGKAEAIPVWLVREAGVPHRRRPRGGLRQPLFVGRRSRARRPRRAARLDEVVRQTARPKHGAHHRASRASGKSRLLAEFFRLLDRRSSEVIVACKAAACPTVRASRSGRSAEIVKAQAGILETDNAEADGAEARERPFRDDPDRQWIGDRLRPLGRAEERSPPRRTRPFRPGSAYICAPRRAKTADPRASRTSTGRTRRCSRSCSRLAIA